MNMSKPSKKAILVSHTHWDRAWYLTFGQFRFRLVHMIDRILDLLESDSSFTCFVLDGQVVLIQDYLEIRPEQTSRLTSLIQRGRIVIGPWYVLPDLFLECGEAIIRNLQFGHRISATYGRELSVGYVPDPFGHIAQLPQLLRGFSIDTFIFMRGMPGELSKKGTLYFDWVSPDGSSVLAYYTKEGYFNAANLGYDHILGRYDLVEPDLERAKQSVEKTLEKLEQHQPSSLFLLNNGVDHMPEQKDIPKIISYLNQEIPDTEFVQGDFSDFMEELKQLPVQESYTGDLMDNPDHPILSNVYSTRTYLKQLNHQTQSRLIRYVEPFQWMVSVYSPDKWASDSSFIEKSWELLLKNHPHDDICGCSIDSVHDQNERQFHEVLDMCDSVLRHGIEQLVGKGVDQITPQELSLDSHDEASSSARRFQDVFVMNPHPFPVTQTVQTYLVFPNHKGEEDEVLPQRKLRLYTPDKQEIPIRIVETKAPYLRAEFIQHTWGRRYDVEFDAELAPLSYGFFRVYETDQNPEQISVSDATPSEIVGLQIQNELYQISCEAGNLRLRSLKTDTVLENVIAFEFVQDNGDTYTFSRANSHVWTADLTSAQQDPTNPERLILEYILTIPEALDTDNVVSISVRVKLGFHRDEEISAHIEYTNLAQDGRLQLLLMTGLDSDVLHTDGHFLVNQYAKKEELIPAEHAERYQNYPGELVYTTHYQGDGSYVSDGDLCFWFSSNGAHEIELKTKPSKTRMAVTLHRSVGALSVSNGSIRRPQAGPHVKTPGAQCLRKMEWKCSFGITKKTHEETLRLIKSSSHSLMAMPVPTLKQSPATGPVPASRSFLSVHEAAVELSALYRSPVTGDVVVRLVNLSGESVKTRLSLGQDFREWCTSDLSDTWKPASAVPLGSNELHVSLPAHAIKTLLFRTPG